MLSEAVAERTTAVPDTVALFAGAVMLIDGAVVSGVPPGGLTGSVAIAMEHDAVVPPFRPTQFHFLAVVVSVVSWSVPVVQVFSRVPQEPFDT